MDKQWWSVTIACGLVFWGAYLAMPGPPRSVPLVVGCWLAGTGVGMLWSVIRRHSR